MLVFSIRSTCDRMTTRKDSWETGMIVNKRKCLTKDGRIIRVLILLKAIDYKRLEITFGITC